MSDPAAKLSLSHQWLAAVGTRPALLGLASTELCERFAVSGLKSLLVLMLVNHVLVGQDGAIFGLTFLRSQLEGIFGALSDVGLASQIYGLCNALLYLSVPLCGLLGDLIIGRHIAVLAGGALIIVGLLMVTSTWLTLPGLFVFAIGVGALKGNLAALVGDLFDNDEARRSGYALYLGFLNAGQMAGPLICGAVAAAFGWMFGLLAAASGMVAGLAIYLAASRYRQTYIARRSQAQTQTQSVLDPRGGGKNLRAVPLLMVVILAIFLCFSAYEQLYNIVLLWASQHVELHALPVSWIVSLDGLLTILLIAVTEWGFRAARRRGREIGELTRVIAGCGFCAAGYLVLACAAPSSGGEGVSMGWVLAYLVLVDLAIVLVWPAGLSLITARAPPALVGLLVGIFYLHGFFANLWVGVSGAFYDRLPLDFFWLLHAGIAASGCVLLLAVGLPLSHWARSRPAVTAAP